MLTVCTKIVKALRVHRAFIIFMLLLVAIRWSVIDHYRVPTGSMIPTVHIGDDIWVNKLAYDIKLPFTDIVLIKTGKPHRGDIIVFKYPEDPKQNYIKRLVGLPGDHIDIKNGVVKVNHQVLLDQAVSFSEIQSRLNSEVIPFRYHEMLGGRSFTVQRIPTLWQPDRFSFTVPEDQYFVMGDNRDDSADSRAWGFVPRDHFKGRAMRVMYSLTFQNWLPTFAWSRTGLQLI